MATVIQAPRVGSETRRLLSTGPAAEQAGEPTLVGQAEPSQGDARKIEDTSGPSGRQSTQHPGADNHPSPERLCAERDAAVARAEAAEKALSAMREQLLSERTQATSEGYQAGLRQAMEKINAEQVQNSEALKELLQSLSEQKNQIIRQAEEAAIEIAYAAVVNILGQAGTNLNLVEAMVKQSLQQVMVREGLVVYLSPADYQRLQQLQKNPASRSSVWETVDIVADTEIVGGCRIESRAGSLDARLEMQMSELKNRLLEVHSLRRTR